MDTASVKHKTRENHVRNPAFKHEFCSYNLDRESFQLL